MEDVASLVALLDELPDLICRYRPDGTILYVNRSYADYFGGTPGSLRGANFLDLVPPGLREVVQRNVESLVHLHPSDPVAVNEHQSTDRYGRVRWLQWTDKALFDAEGRVCEIVAVGRDVTDRRHAEEQVRFLAYRDPLTGLFNRRSLVAELEGALRQAATTRTNLGVIFVDVDGFKAINDQHGHAVGDQVLVHIARQLTGCLGPQEVIARMGGDEFVVVCPGIESSQELERLAQRVGKQVTVDSDPTFSVSVGTAFAASEVDVDDLLGEADRQMYRHKSRRQAPAP